MVVTQLGTTTYWLQHVRTHTAEVSTIVRIVMLGLHYINTVAVFGQVCGTFSSSWQEPVETFEPSLLSYFTTNDETSR